MMRPGMPDWTISCAAPRSLQIPLPEAVSQMPSGVISQPSVVELTVNVADYAVLITAKRNEKATRRKPAINSSTACLFFALRLAVGLGLRAMCFGLLFFCRRCLLAFQKMRRRYLIVKMRCDICGAASRLALSLRGAFFATKQSRTFGAAEKRDCSVSKFIPERSVGFLAMRAGEMAGEPHGY